MLSTLPKLADRSFIYGFYLPTLLFSVVALILFQDCPAAEGMLSDLAAKEITKAAYVLLMVWVMAIALLTLNNPLYRFLEGYTFPDWLAEPLRARNRDGLQKALDEIRTLFQRRRLEGKQFPSADLRRYRILRRDTANSMPSTSPDVLPTAFGNAIRAFELYSRDIYGADGVWVWLRLATVIPKDVVEQIQDSRTPIDFLINCCLYSFAIAALAFGRVIYAGFRQQPIVTTPVGSWLAFGAGGLLAACLFYRWAVTRVPGWGNWVMSAYDCYLPALAKQLGYELPPTEAERIVFWNAFSRQLIYRRDPDGKLAFSVEKWIKPAADAEKTNTPQTVALTINVENDAH